MHWGDSSRLTSNRWAREAVAGGCRLQVLLVQHALAALSCCDSHEQHMPGTDVVAATEHSLSGWGCDCDHVLCQLNVMGLVMRQQPCRVTQRPCLTCPALGRNGFA